MDSIVLGALHDGFPVRLLPDRRSAHVLYDGLQDVQPWQAPDIADDGKAVCQIDQTPPVVRSLPVQAFHMEHQQQLLEVGLSLMSFGEPRETLLSVASALPAPACIQATGDDR